MGNNLNNFFLNENIDINSRINKNSKYINSLIEYPSKLLEFLQ